MINGAKMGKYMDFVQTKVKMLVNEKSFQSNGYDVKYMLEQHDSDALIIVFSGFTRIGLKARYNYNRTLQHVKVNKLFILDDFGYDERGAYYLGHNMDFKIQDSVAELIQTIKQKLAIERTIYTGTSKGGYAALYFGVTDPESIIIPGAPQYYLGRYLNSTENYIENCLKYIIGKDITEGKLAQLNRLLPERVANYSDNHARIYLHYSFEEHNFTSHIADLIIDLDKNRYNYTLDIHDYKEHNDVGLYFPKFLTDTLEEIL